MYYVIYKQLRTNYINYVCALYDIRRDMFENLLHLNFDNFNILSLHDRFYHLVKFEWKEYPVI